jgi:hypothetical protein
MSVWRRVALERFPDLRSQIERTESVGMLWIELYSTFCRAHEEPVDNDLIRRFYLYAWWCLKESKSTEVSDKAGMGFYEELPMNKLVRERMQEFLTTGQFMKAAGYICHFLGSEEFEKFKEDFIEKRRWFEQKNKKRR